MLLKKKGTRKKKLSQLNGGEAGFPPLGLFYCSRNPQNEVKETRNFPQNNPRTHNHRSLHCTNVINLCVLLVDKPDQDVLTVKCTQTILLSNFNKMLPLILLSLHVIPLQEIKE